MATNETAISDTEGDITQHSENKNLEEENVLSERKIINETNSVEKNSPETQVKTYTASGNQYDINTEKHTASENPNSQEQNLHEVQKMKDLGNRSLPENTQNYKSENNVSGSEEHCNVEEIVEENVFEPTCYRWGNGLTLIQGNIRSMRKNFARFKDYMSLISFKPNIIILTEIWIYDKEIPDYLIEGYNHFWKRKDPEREDSKRAGGVIAYIDQNIKAIELLNDFQTADVLELYFMWKNIKYFLIAVYRSPSDNTRRFIEDLDMELAAINERCIMTGDFNIDISKKKNDEKTKRITKDYLEMLESNKFISCHECVTREAKKTCLDHLFVKGIDLNDIVTYVIEVNLSDHYFVGMHMDSKSDDHRDPSVEASLSITDTATEYSNLGTM